MAKKAAKKAAKTPAHDYYDNEEDGEATAPPEPERDPIPPEYANDVDACEKGLPVGGRYRTGSVLKVRVV